MTINVYCEKPNDKSLLKKILEFLIVTFFLNCSLASAHLSASKGHHEWLLANDAEYDSLAIYE
jgi:hypothetical protein